MKSRHFFKPGPGIWAKKFTHAHYVFPPWILTQLWTTRPRTSATSRLIDRLACKYWKIQSNRAESCYSSFSFPYDKKKYITVFFFSITILFKVFLLISFYYITERGLWMIYHSCANNHFKEVWYSTQFWLTKCWCLRLKVMSWWSIQLSILPWKRQNILKVKCNVDYYPRSVSLIT